MASGVTLGSIAARGKIVPAGMRRWPFATGALLTASLLFAAPALAAPRYASPGADGPPATCPIGDPCDLHDAVEDAAVQDGDVVNLLPGIYSLPAGDSIHVTENITIQGNPGDPRPTITGSQAPLFLLLMDDGGTLRDFRIAADQGGGGYTIALTAGGVIERVEATATGTTSSPYLLRNVSLRNSVGRVAAANGYALEVQASGAEGAMDLHNVTLVASGANSTGAYFNADSTIGPSSFDATIHNSIVRGVANGVAAADTDGNPGDDDLSVAISFSNHSGLVNSGTGDSVVLSGGGNQTAPPTFVSPPGDFREAAGSPTIDSGSPDGLAGSLDLLRGPRALGESIDIGAQEFLPRCAGRRATLAGGPSAEKLNGTRAADVIVGGGGGDKVRGLGGADLICGGGGGDVLRGGQGPDRLLGGPRRDRLFGGPGGDLLRGGAGRDLLVGGPGPDRRRQ